MKGIKRKWKRANADGVGCVYANNSNNNNGADGVSYKVLCAERVK